MASRSDEIVEELHPSDFADPSYSGLQETVRRQQAIDAGVGLSDIGHTLAASTAGLGAGLYGFAGHLGMLSDRGEQLRQYLGETEKYQQSLLSPSAQEEAEKSVFTTSHLGRHLTLGLTSMAPSLIAAAVPVGMVARAFGVTTKLGASLAMAAGSAPVSLSMGGEVFNAVTDEVKNASDDELKRGNPFYAGLRRDGMSEEDARKKTVNYIVGWKPEIVAGIAELANRFGTPFHAATAAAGIPGKGLVRGALTGAAEQTIAQGVLGGAQAGITQEGKREVHPDMDFHWNDVLHAAVESGTLGGLTGLATGAIAGRRGAQAAPKKTPNMDTDAATAVAALPQTKADAGAEKGIAFAPGTEEALPGEAGAVTPPSKPPGAPPGMEEAAAAVPPGTPLAGVHTPVAESGPPDPAHLATQIKKLPGEEAAAPTVEPPAEAATQVPAAAKSPVDLPTAVAGPQEPSPAPGVQPKPAEDAKLAQMKVEVAAAEAKRAAKPKPPEPPPRKQAEAPPPVTPEEPVVAPAAEKAKAVSAVRAAEPEKVVHEDLAAKARKREGARVSKAEAAAAGEGKVGLVKFGSSGDKKKDELKFTGQSDKDAVKSMVSASLAAAEKEGREPNPLHVKLSENIKKNKRGRGAAEMAARKEYMELRHELAAEEDRKVAEGKTERHTAEEQEKRAKAEEQASFKAREEMAKTVIKAHEPVDARKLPDIRKHLDQVLSAAEKGGVDVPASVAAAKGEPHLEHLAELKQLQHLLSEKELETLTSLQKAQRQLRAQEAMANTRLLQAGDVEAFKEQRKAEALKKEQSLDVEGTTTRPEATWEGPHAGAEAEEFQARELAVEHPEEESVYTGREGEEPRQLTAEEQRTKDLIEAEKDKEKEREEAREASRKEREERAAAEKAAAEKPAEAPAPGDKGKAAVVVSNLREERRKRAAEHKAKVELAKAEVEKNKAKLDEELFKAEEPPEGVPTTQAMPRGDKSTLAAEIARGRVEHVAIPDMPTRQLPVHGEIRLPHATTGEEGGGRVVTPTRVLKLNDMLRSTAKQRIMYGDRGLHWMTNTMRERIIQLLGDMPVYVLKEKDHDMLARGEAGGLYSAKFNRITIPESTFNGDRTYLHQALLHEGIHAAFDHIVRTTPWVRAEIEKMMARILKDKDRLMRDHDFTERDFYGTTDVGEFVTEAFSRPQFQQILKLITYKRPAEFTKGFAAAKLYPGLQDAWTKLRFIVRKALGLRPHHDTLLDRAMDVGHLLDYTRQYRTERDLPVTFAEHPAFGGFVGENIDPGARPMAIPREPPRAPDPTRPPEEEARTKLGQFKDTVTTALKGTSLSDFGRKALAYVTSADQLRQKNQGLFHGELKGNVVHDLYYSMMEKGHYADELKKEGEDLIGDLINTREKVGTKNFDRFSDLLFDASWNGIDPSQVLGAGRNAHLAISQTLQKKMGKQGWDAVAHEASMEGWQARGKWEKLNKEYKELTGAHPEMADLMERSFQYFANAQHEMARAGIEKLLEGNLYRGDIKQEADRLLNERGSSEFKEAVQEEHGEDFLHELLRQRSMDVQKGPYAPLMRRGDWVTHGRYKIEAPENARQISHNEFEFNTRKEAHDFVANHDLYAADVSTRYYNPDDPSLGAEAGKRTTREGLTSAGNPVEKTYVRLEDQYMKQHPTEKEALQDYRALKDSGLMREVYTPEVKQNGVFQSHELTGPTLALIDKRLQQNDIYKNAGQHQRLAMRQALQEASLAARAGIRMQHRRLPRRHVLGFSNDFVQTMYEYNNSQGNFRAMQKYRPQIDDALMRMRREQVDRRHEDGNTERSIAAAEWEKRAVQEDPSADMSKWAGATRRINMLSYLDRMLRPSHLILHQTHLPMITAPAMAGRHGLQAYAEIMKAWRSASAYKKLFTDPFYAAKEGAPKFLGGKGKKAITFKGTDFDKYMDDAFRKEKDGSQLLQVFDTARKANLMHITGGIEVGKYGPSSQKTGILAAADRALAKLDTIYRHASNAADSMIRHAALAAAFRLERDKLTQQGKFTKAEVMEKATQYAMDVVSNTQGNYAANNAAPIFQNRILKPFLQFKQFPQMMYHLLIKNAVDAFRHEDLETRRAARKSLFAVLASHTVMTGLLGGLPLELPRAMGALSKGLGITSGDWQDLEEKEAELLHGMFGQVGGDLMLHGLSRAAGVDAHHRLGLNSFFTFGIDDVNDWNSFAGFMLNQPAPIGLAKDYFQGVTRMLHGDLEGGFARAFPLQALRDVKKAWTGVGAGGYQLSPAERALSLTGFTTSGEAAAMEDTRKRIREAEEKKDERSRTMGIYFRANTPEQIKAATKAIEEFNARTTGRNKIGVKGLEAIKKSRAKQQEEARQQF